MSDILSPAFQPALIDSWQRLDQYGNFVAFHSCPCLLSIYLHKYVHVDLNTSIGMQLFGSKWKEDFSLVFAEDALKSVGVGLPSLEPSHSPGRRSVPVGSRAEAKGYE